MLFYTLAIASSCSKDSAKFCGILPRCIFSDANIHVTTDCNQIFYQVFPGTIRKSNKCYIQIKVRSTFPNINRKNAKGYLTEF